MSKLEANITKAWYHNKRWIYLFTPVEIFYRAILPLRKKLYSSKLLKSEHPGVPVIVVGNITVGGTGKTPVVIELVNYLQQQGWKPGVISRGYGGDAEQYPFLVTAQTDVSVCGDEPVLIQRNTSANIVIDPNRSRGAKLLVEQGCDIIVSDDGLQHLGLKRDYEIVVIDGQRGFGNQHCLPVGPLREPVSNISHSDFILTNGNKNFAPEHQASTCFKISATNLVEINSGEEFPLSWLESRELHAVAGIGNPQRFFDLLGELGSKPICHSFPDHHVYKMSDIPNDRKSLVVTEKDAVKMEQFRLQDCLYLKIQAVLPDKLYQHIDTFLEKMSKS